MTPPNGRSLVRRHADSTNVLTFSKPCKSASSSTTARWGPTSRSAILVAGRLLGQGGLQRTSGVEPSGHYQRHPCRVLPGRLRRGGDRTPLAATRIVLAEYDLQDKVAEINMAAAKLAKEVAQQFSTQGKPRFVAGSIGPDDQAAVARAHHVRRDGGCLRRAGAGADRRRRGRAADRDLRRTCCRRKRHWSACFEAMKKAGKRLPVTVQVTLRSHGNDAAGHRNRRGADRAGAVRCRRHRSELRHRTGGDERCGSLSRAEFDASTSPCCPTPDCRRTKAGTPSTS